MSDPHEGCGPEPADPGAELNRGLGLQSLDYDEVGEVSTLRWYLAKVFAEGELRPDHEISDLARTLREGQEARALLCGHPPYVSADDGELRLLQDAVRAGELAKEAMVKANLRLVISMAKRRQGAGVELLDLIQAGNFGLLRAVEKFDPDRGSTLANYAAWWIRQAIDLTILEARMITYPERVIKFANSVRYAITLYTDEHSRQPNVIELAEYMKVPIEDIQDVLALPAVALSIDGPVGEDADTDLASITGYHEPQFDAVDQRVSDEKLRILLVFILEESQATDIFLMSLFANGEDGRPIKNGEIASRLGVQPYVVTRAIAKCVAQLKSPYASKLLEAYFR